MDITCAIISGLLWRMLLGDTSNLQDAAGVQAIAQGPPQWAVNRGMVAVDSEEIGFSMI